MYHKNNYYQLCLIPQINFNFDSNKNILPTLAIQYIYISLDCMMNKKISYSLYITVILSADLGLLGALQAQYFVNDILK